ncbi:MAG: glycoside hydrolase TIM-barrel-like domain-containing protein [Pseudomonadota bacterium]
MATLVLQTAGSLVGNSLGGPLGATLGRAAGAIAGQFIDQALFGPGPKRVSGPRLSDLHVQGSSEGSPIPQVFGRARLAGQLIWATRFDEVASTRTEKAGGKGAPSAGRTAVTEYSYFANFAVGLCEGEITRIGRVWADGKEIDITPYTHRVYTGSETQLPDSLIEAKQGAGQAPAYRGLAYVVFEGLPLAKFGNRLPQFSFEVFRALDDVESRIGAVAMIPGLTEFGYDPRPITRDAGGGETVPENTNALAGRSDWSLAVDQLQATCPNVKTVALVVSWFGDDLACGRCRVRPGVENRQKVTRPHTWSVAGDTRSTAHLVSEVDGRPAFGGTPSDSSVREAIRDLKERGLKVTFYPFLNMDVPGGEGQAAYPWRGRITCDPPPGHPGSPDKTHAVRPQVAAFFSGYRPMIEHYARLCREAGGVDAFLIGSELRGLTTLRDSPDHYPVVDELVDLARDVKQILPDAEISYGADWSEYFGHHPQDGSRDVFFHLDPLWTSPDIAFVGIDNYMPLSDWRDHPGHADALHGARSIYDQAYLRANVRGGEGFSWYYRTPEDRRLQRRTGLYDDAYGKAWVFRYKDLSNWWLRPHFNRPGGVEAAEPTPWVPESKPIRFTEAGCPAVDKGTNQPNVFNDGKSDESALPYFSSGARDDLIQRAYIDALTAHYAQRSVSANPVSEIYDGPMVDPNEITFWAWDARPFPAFPYLLDVWSDGVSYERGHWLNGRLGAVTLKALVRAILARHGFGAADVSDLSGLLDGYVIDRSMSARDALDPLSLAFFFDGAESGGKIIFRHKDQPVTATLKADRLVEQARDEPLFERTRAQETELPGEVSLSYADGLIDYRKAAVSARRLSGFSRRKASADLPAVLSQAGAQERADIWLQDLWAGRERLEAVLPPSLLALEPGDAVAFGGETFTLSEISDTSARAISARRIERSLFAGGTQGPARGARPARALALGQADLLFMDLPLLRGDEPAHEGWLAAFAKPWPGRLALLRLSGEAATLARTLNAPATQGVLLWDLYAGPTARLDRGNRVQVQLAGGALESVSERALLDGANLAAVRGAGGRWEVLQFQTAELVGPDRYEISLLLRGQAGTEAAMANPVPAGAPFVLLNEAVVGAGLSASDVGREITWRYGPSARDAGDDAFAQTVHAFSGAGLKPLSPVHVRGRRVSGGVEFSWVRRTRIGGDAWSQVEVPLGEDAEAYEVDILRPDGTALRTLASAQPRLLYPTAQIEADFGQVPAQFTVRVSQLSATAGRGTPREETTYV